MQHYLAFYSTVQFFLVQLNTQRHTTVFQVPFGQSKKMSWRLGTAETMEQHCSVTGTGIKFAGKESLEKLRGQVNLTLRKDKKNVKATLLDKSAAWDHFWFRVDYGDNGKMSVNKQIMVGKHCLMSIGSVASNTCPTPTPTPAPRPPLLASISHQLRQFHLEQHSAGQSRLWWLTKHNCQLKLLTNSCIQQIPKKRERCAEIFIGFRQHLYVIGLLSETLA